MKKLLTLLLAVLLLAGCAGNKPGTFEAGKNKMCIRDSIGTKALQ